MARPPSVRILLAAAALAAAASLAAAQDPPAAPPPGGASPPPAARPDAAAAPDSGKAERLRRARERWERLSPAERDGLLRRFETWSRLPKEEREEIRRRFDEIGGREGAAVVRRRMEDLRRASPEQIQRMRLQASVLDRLWGRFTATLPPRVAERWEALPPAARERLRHRVCRGFVAAGRDAVVRRYATEPERAAVEGADAEARRAALEAVRARLREEVLAPRREELAGLDPARRKEREAVLLEEHFWSCAREGLKEKLPQIRASLERSLSEKGERGPRRGPDWFQREFGVPQEDLGAPSAARALVLALHMQKPEARPAFLASVRPELRRIAALPPEGRGGALRALLDRIR